MWGSAKNRYRMRLGATTRCATVRIRAHACRRQCHTMTCVALTCVAHPADHPHPGHRQVGFAVYHQHMGAGSDDEEAFDDVAGDADIITDGEEGVDTEAMGDDAYGLYARRESILRAHPAGQPLPRTGTVGLVAFLVLVAGVAALGALLRGPLALMRHPQPTPVQRLSHML